MQIPMILKPIMTVYRAIVSRISTIPISSISASVPTVKSTTILSVWTLPPQKKSESYSFLNEEARGNIEKNVLNFSPTVNFRYKHSKRTQLQIIYRGKGIQLRVNDLQPVVVPPLPLTRMVIGMHPVLFP